MLYRMEAVGAKISMNTIAAKMFFAIVSIRRTNRMESILNTPWCFRFEIVYLLGLVSSLVKYEKPVRRSHGLIVCYKWQA